MGDGACVDADALEANRRCDGVLQVGVQAELRLKLPLELD
jgi:hypothetical protein